MTLQHNKLAVISSPSQQRSMASSLTSMKLLIVFTVYMLYTAYSDVPCEDSASWCNSVRNYRECSNYPPTPYYTQTCRKTCGVCISESECGQGYYRPDCKPCSEACTGGSCNQAASADCLKGCDQGKYGLRCDKTCPGNCYAETCDQLTGACISGCKQKKWYGDKCDTRCNEHCTNQFCDQTGYCTYGCKSGWQGDKCTEPEAVCSTHCIDSECSTNGECTQGCEAGWFGSKCDKQCNGCINADCDSYGECSQGCKTGWFGSPTCSEKCNTNCERDSCDHISGKCSQGCDRGYYGDRCTKYCSVNCRSNTCNQNNGDCTAGCTDGYYLGNCTATCSPHCKSSKCYKNTGKCYYGCYSGWFGPNCDQQCSNCETNSCNRTGTCKHGCKIGWYGDRCSESCSSNCKDDKCDQFSGRCEECTAGLHGEDCSLPCSRNCKNSECDQDMGKCSLGCDNSWFGDKCDQRCSDKCSRRFCQLDSSSNKPICGKGCVDGYKGSYCQTRCPDGCRVCGTDRCRDCKSGFYGVSCEKQCPMNCDGPCDKSNGKCSHCVVGFYGEKCHLNCSDGCELYHQNVFPYCDKQTGRCRDGCKTGKFGATCDKSCSSGCKDAVCVRTNGHCFHGCKEVFYGNFCNQSCSYNCKNSKCEVSSYGLRCVDGCKDGWKGSYCQDSCPDSCSRCNNYRCLKCEYGLYGGKCEKSCSQNCVKGVCNSYGNCEEGCIDGFYGSKCTRTCLSNCLKCEQNYGSTCYKCKPGWFGKYSCNKRCDNCQDGICDRTHGDCKKGCSPGFYGPKCNQKCSDNCKPSRSMNYIYCNQSSGFCLNGCVIGKFGNICDKNCSVNCVEQLCNQSTGVCQHGCIRGQFGPKCEMPCSEWCNDNQCEQATGFCTSGCHVGKFGDKCHGSCSANCLNSLCAQKTGECTAGCDTGWMGKNCSKECPEKRFGHNCNESCGFCSGNLTCISTNGSCPRGCADLYTGIMCKKLQQNDADSGTSSSLMIVLAVLCVLLIAIVIAVGFIIFKKRKSIFKRNHSSGDGYNMVPLNGTGTSSNFACERHSPLRKGQKRKQNGAAAKANIHAEQNADSIYYNFLPNKLSSTVVKVPDFWNYLQQMKASRGFKEQFEKLPTGLLDACDIAMKPENKGKNRYKNICAFDSTRVILDRQNNDPNSDYINACYINGYNTPQQYVASQGPVDVILNDFWRMIWQLKTSKIVMLTNLVEEGRMKCIMYWPEIAAGAVQFGEIVVECNVEEVLAHFTVRTLKIYKASDGHTPVAQCRLIKQFHFTSWPDRGVPTDIASLVEFYFKVKNTPMHNQGPMVVHCSAGIGRTGTFLALSYLVDQKSSNMVDVYDCIHKMRHQRVNMIQTEEQYEFLHDALAEAILAGGTTVSTVDFVTTFENLQKVNPETKVIKLKEQFEMLNMMSPRDKIEEFITATSKTNMSKNRFSDILASDYYRPFLSTPAAGGTDYINAVYLPAYKEKRQFLLTQMPLPNTIIDFWRMIYESDSHSVIMLNKISENDQDIGIYWPQDKQPTVFDPFVVKLKDKEDYVCYKVLTLSLIKLTNDGLETETERIVKVFQCEFWPQGRIVPDSAAPVFAVMETVQQWQQLTNNGPITVHCIDGVERSGLVCVLIAIIDRLRIEQDVSIVQTINQMRVCRNQLIRNYEQFKFCYSAVTEYLEGFSTYSNFA